MKKNRKTSILKRLTALVMALLMAFGILSDYTEALAYTSDVASGSTAVADLGGTSSSDWSGFQREGPYIAVTPIYNDSIENSITVNDLSTDAEEAGDETIENSFRAERYVGTQEAQLSLPSQNASTLLFYSYSIWKNYKSILTGNWNKLTSFDYDKQYKQYRVYAMGGHQTSSTDTSSISLRETDEYLNNIVFSGDTTGFMNKNGVKHPSSDTLSDNNTMKALLCNGVYLDILQKQFETGDSDYPLDFSSLTTQGGMSKEDANKFIDKVMSSGNTKTNLTNAEILWEYITDISIENGSYVTDPGTQVDKFLAMAYDTLIQEQAEKYSFSWSADISACAELGDTGMEGLTINWLDTGDSHVNDMTMIFNEDGYQGHINPDANYCNNLYQLVYMDLLFSGYSIAKAQQGGTDTGAAKYWRNAILSCLMSGDNNDPGVRLSFQVGLVVRGQAATGGTFYHVFATCNDLVNASYGLENTTAAATTSGKAVDPTKVSQSISKPYSGYYGTSGSGTEKSRRWYLGTSKNKESQVQKVSGDIKYASNKVYNTTDYQTYYQRLKNAVKNAGATGLFKTGSTSEKKGVTYRGTKWYSYNALCHVLNTIYSYDSGVKTVNDVQPDTAFIELLRARNTGGYQAKDNNNNGVTDSFGGGYIVGHAFRSTKTAAIDIGARLEISSSQNNSQTNSKTTGSTSDDSAYTGPDFSGFTEGDEYFEAAGTAYAIGTGSGASAAIKVSKVKDDAGNTVTLDVNNKTATIHDTVKLRLSIHSTDDSMTLKSFLNKYSDGSAPDISVKFTVDHTSYTSTGKQKTTENDKSVSGFADDSYVESTISTTVDKFSSKSYKSVLESDKAKYMISGKKDTKWEDHDIKLRLKDGKITGEGIRYQATVTITYKDKKGKEQALTAVSNYASVAYAVSGSKAKPSIEGMLMIKSSNADRQYSASGTYGTGKTSDDGENASIYSGYMRPDYSSSTKGETYTDEDGVTWGSNEANAETSSTADYGTYYTSSNAIKDTVSLKIAMRFVKAGIYENVKDWLDLGKKADLSTLKIKYTLSTKSSSKAAKHGTITIGSGTFCSATSFTEISISQLKKYTDYSTTAWKVFLSGTDTWMSGTGFTLATGKGATVKYKATITLSYKTKKGEKQTITVKTNTASVSYAVSDPEVYTKYAFPRDTIESTGTTVAYAELKEGTLSYANGKTTINETYEAMAGVPSTRSLYYGTGGSEFIVSLQAEYDPDNTAVRTYTSTFAGTSCEFKVNDQQKAMTAGQEVTTALVADKDDNTYASAQTITSGKNSAVLPEGASSSTTAVKGHGSGTTFTAEWKGTITNQTTKPSEDTFDEGKAGPTCIGSGYEVGNGATGTVSTASTNWDVTAYNKALSQAIAWAKGMEATNNTADGTVYYIADSDGMKRVYHVGTAQITVTMSGGSRNYAIECGTSATFSKNGTYTSGAASSASVASSESSVLGSGWSYTHGTNATGSYSQNANCNVTYSGEQSCSIKTDSWSLTCSKEVHAHGGQGSTCYPKTGTNYTYDADGNITSSTDVYATSPQCGKTVHAHDGAPAAPSTSSSATTGNGCTWSGGNHSCGHTHSFTEGVKWTDGASNNISYTITVTFKDGWLDAVNYDGDGSITVEKKGSLSSLPACALCGTCHEHELPAIQDMWKQTVTFDTIRFTNLTVWKIDTGYTTGLTEIRMGSGYDGTEYDTVVTGLTQADPNIWYSIATADTSAGGRLRYSLETGTDDNVKWTEFTTAGGTGGTSSAYTRSNKCDGLSGSGTLNGVQTGTYAAKNPAQDTRTGHERDYASGCLYARTSYSDTVDIHKKAVDKSSMSFKKTGYTDTVDKKDIASYEWNRFNDRRNMLNNATAVSDFLILQTTSGDIPVVYFADTVSTCATTSTSKDALEADDTLQKVIASDEYLTGTSPYAGTASTTQTNFASTLQYHDTSRHVKLKDRFGSTEYYDYEDYSTGWAKMWTNNAYVTSSLVSPVGSYNGLYSLRSTSPNCYSGTGSGMQIATVMDNDRNVYFGTTKVVTDGTNAKLTYNAMGIGGDNDKACASSREYRRARTTGLLMYVGGITQNAANPNGTYVTGQSWMFWREILKYDTTVDYTGEAVASGDAPWGFEYALTSTEDTTLDALDATKKHYGYTRYSSYSSSTTKINDIIVFDPVTTEGAMVIGKDSDLDQRVDGQALAALANREAEEGQDGCPGNAAECSVRPDADLTCTYKKRQAVAAFSTKTLDDFEKALGSYADEETATDSDYTWYLRNSVENAYGTNATVSLADSFLTIEGSGSQHYLYADGTVNSSLLLSWGSLGIDTEYTSQTYTIGAYFYFEQYNTTTLFSTGDWTLNYAANSFQLVNNKTGEAYRTGYDSGSLNTWTLVFMKFCMDGSTPTVTAGGKKLSFDTKLGTQGTDSTTGSGIYIGNTPNGTYQGAFRVKDITVYREAGSTAHTSACYAADGTLDCQEPHHTGGHYDTDNTTCWMSCLEYYTSTLGKEKGEEKSRELHNALGSTVTTPNGTIGKADFILLDNYFDIYFPTSGNFYESSAHAIGTLSSTTGIGYYNGMSSAEWTREKLVQFPCPVLYYRASTGKWEEYAANEWISLDVKIEDAATQERYKKVLEGFGYSITNVNIGTGIEYYNFYTQLKGGEVSMGTVKFAAEAINNQTVPAVEIYGKEFYEIALDPSLAYLKDTDANLDCPAADSSSTNRFTHYHSAYRTQYLDVVGRIGNLIVEDTDDLRFANLFKKSTLLDDDDTNDGWYLDGIAGTVDPSKQNNYMVWEGLVDLRGLKVSAENGYYNTYGTLPWTVVSSDYDTADGLLNTPVSGDKNNIASLAGEPLRLGYDILWDIETIGNYELGKLAVKPYYYILDTETSTLIPADLYMEDGTDTKALNLFAALDGSDTSLLDSITDYPVYLNWENEQTRRNYTGVEKTTTEHVRDFIGYYVYGSDGQALSYTTTVKRELDDGTYDTYTIDRPYVRHASIPYGTYYSLGNYQLLVAGERARTFIGSSVTTALGTDINGSNNVELDSCSDSALYGVKGQRWHLKLGTPSSAKFTAYVDRDGDGVAEHVSPDTYVTYSDGTIGTAGDEYSDSDRYVILLTADITAIGETYSLHYTQGTKNGTIEVNGKKFTFTDLEHGGIPTLIAVYSTTSSSLDDVDTMQSH